MKQYGLSAGDNGIMPLESGKERVGKKSKTPLHTGMVWLPAQQQQNGYQVCTFLTKMTLVKLQYKR